MERGRPDPGPSAALTLYGKAETTTRVRLTLFLLAVSVVVVAGFGSASGGVGSRAAALEVVIGMPFAGQWSYNVERKPPYTDQNSSHPSVHRLYTKGSDWSTDLYAKAGTPVTLLLSSAAGPVKIGRRSSGDSCGPGVGGQRVSYKVYVGKAYVGWLSFSHLDNPKTSPPYENGMVIGNVTTEGTKAGCYETGHVHLEVSNDGTSGHACWVDHGNVGKRLAQGVAVGRLGSANAAIRQACAEAPGRPNPGAAPATPRFAPLPPLAAGDQELGSCCGSVAFSPSGRLLAASGYDKQLGQVIVLFDTRSWRQVRALPIEAGGVDFDFSPDGRLLVIAAGDSLTGYDLRRNRPLWTRTIESVVLTVGFVSKSTFALQFNRVDSRAEVSLWSATNGKRLKSLSRDGALLPQLATSAAGHRLAFVTRANQTKVHFRTTVLDATSGRIVARLPRPGEDAKYVSSPVLSADGRLLASRSDPPPYGDPERLRIYDLGRGKILTTVPGIDVEPLAWSRAGVLAFRLTGSVRIWEARTRRLAPASAVPFKPRRNETIYEAAWSPDGLILAGSGNARIYLWRVN